VNRTLNGIYARATEDDGCLLWQGELDRYGYGRIRGRDRRRQQVHRRVWELGHGTAIPEGFDVHHTCRRRHCVRVEHLELLPHRDHSLLHHTSGDRCLRGHDDWQVRADNGRRICRECRRLHARTTYWANLERERARKRKTVHV